MADPAPVSGRIRDLLIGQGPALERVSRARRESRLAHAYLILGPRGGGRTRLALALAQELLCAEPDPPGGACAACLQVARLTHPDLHLLVPLSKDELDDPEEAGRILRSYAGNRWAVLPSAATIGIDRVRALKEEVAKARVAGPRRVVVLSGTERLTEQAAQSALKLVEEPPAETVLLLTAEDPSRLLPTLVSRCQRIAVRPLERETLRRILADELAVPEADAALLSALAGGSVGRALEIRDSGVLETRDRLLEAFDIDPDRPPGPREIERRVATLERGWNAGLARRAAELLLLWYRDLAVAGAGLPEDALAHADRAEAARRSAARVGPAELGRRIRVVEEMVRAVDQWVNPALALHAALGRLASGAEVEDPLD